jgi:hypothetical protein
VKINLRIGTRTKGHNENYPTLMKLPITKHKEANEQAKYFGVWEF